MWFPDITDPTTERLAAIVGLLILALSIGNYYYVFCAICLAGVVLSQKFESSRFIAIGCMSGAISSAVVGLIP
ncbi:MAG: hypothetical protein EOO77_23155 [Oxalobacteraceae bacterium]|nr:MAG: hypothetical protein EOO77_23155 [Oxalobacteraceae bacterium]